MRDVLAKNKANDLKYDFVTFPFYIISSPFKGFTDIKYFKQGKISFAFCMLAFLGILNILTDAYTGFVLSGYYSEIKYVNYFYVILMTVLPIALFVIANWSITAITNGIGKVKEIFMVYMYASYPALILNIIGLILSNFVTVEEAAFAMFFFSFARVAFGFYLFIGLIIIHDYTLGKALLMIIFTILSMAIISFVLALLMSLSTEVINFFVTVFTELKFSLL